MSLLSKLKPRYGSTGSRKRVGRGHGSGMGGTSTKGDKGQKARSGGSVRWGFEGGQSPLVRRLPKFGFSNVDFANRFEIVNLGQLNGFEGVVDTATLKAAGLISTGPVKVLAKGKLEKKLTIKANHFSNSAKSAIEAAGGKAEVVG